MTRTDHNYQSGTCYLLTGPRRSGKTLLARELVSRLREHLTDVHLIDDKPLRGLSDAVEYAAIQAAKTVAMGGTVIAAMYSPDEDGRAGFRAAIEDAGGRCVVVYCYASPDVRKRRDADLSEVYEVPPDAIVVNTGAWTVDKCASTVELPNLKAEAG